MHSMEYIVKQLRALAASQHEEAELASKVLEKIEELQRPPTTHHLEAVSLDITTPPGGGL
jgi:hypothetical protein